MLAVVLHRATLEVLVETRRFAVILHVVVVHGSRCTEFRLAEQETQLGFDVC